MALSAREQGALAAIERQLTCEDPQLARRFAAAAPAPVVRGPGTSPDWQAALPTWLTLWVVVLALVLVSGAGPGDGLLVASAVVLLVAAHQARALARRSLIARVGRARRGGAARWSDRED